MRTQATTVFLALTFFAATGHTQDRDLEQILADIKALNARLDAARQQRASTPRNDARPQRETSQPRNNFRADSDAYYGQDGAGVKTIVEGLGPDWEIESRTTAVNRRTGQRIEVSGSASPRGTSTSVNQSQKPLVPMDVPIYLTQNGQYVQNGAGSYLAILERRNVPEGSTPYDTRPERDGDRGNPRAVFYCAAPGTVYASGRVVSGYRGGAPSNVGQGQQTYGGQYNVQRNVRRGKIVIKKNRWR